MSNSWPPFDRLPCRLIVDDEADGATNMAVDEAILTSVAEGSSQPTLRFFAWSPPCLSLGRSQPLSDVKLQTCSADGVDVVRRPTGGRSILHTNELTYSLTLPQHDPRVAGDILQSYRFLSEGLLKGVRLLGIEAVQAADPKKTGADPTPVCFETPSLYEITAGGRKLIGSAQWRAQGGVLQHGSLPLYGDLARIVDYLVLEKDGGQATPAELEEQRRRVRARATTVKEVLGHVAPFDLVAEALTDGFAQALNMCLTRGALSDREQALVRQLCGERYASSEWTARL